MLKTTELRRIEVPAAFAIQRGAILENEKCGHSHLTLKRINLKNQNATKMKDLSHSNGFPECVVMRLFQKPPLVGMDLQVASELKCNTKIGCIAIPVKILRMDEN